MEETEFIVYIYTEPEKVLLRLLMYCIDMNKTWVLEALIYIYQNKSNASLTTEI